MSNQRPTCPFGAPRWEPNDRKRVRSSAPLVSIARAAGGTKGTSGALDRIRPNALVVVRFPAGGTRRAARVT